MSLLVATGISKRFRRTVALTDASISLARGEILGLVGASGSGKTTLGRIIAGLEAADAGSLAINGATLFAPGQKRITLPHLRRIGMVFQDPASSLNPRLRAHDIVAEGLHIAGTLRRAEIDARVAEALRFVGLHPADADKRPAQFSGGQRQRLGIARAVILEPEILIADEATSSLDVSVQMQILNLLLDVRDRMGLSLIMITHNIAVVDYLCDSVAVLAGGRIVEQGPTRVVLDAPRHADTKRLLAAVPRL